MPDPLQAQMILEILGRPQEHIKEALNTLVVKLGSENGVKILDKKYNPPVPVKDSKDLFTAFAELTLEFDELGNYFGILFAYMPSHIEIIKPESLKLTNFDLNDTGNKLVQRLHSYDAIAKNMINEREFLLNKLKEVSPKTFKEITTPPKEDASSQPIKETPSPSPEKSQQQNSKEKQQ